MANFKRGDVVKVPFPYADRATRQSRPALVVATAGPEESHGILWVVMITSAENSGWPGDVEIAHFAAAGLPAASVVRTAKMATIDAQDATRLGKLSAPALRQVTHLIAESLGLA